MTERGVTERGAVVRLHPVLEAVTARLRERSRVTRQAYLSRLEGVDMRTPRRSTLACCNLAHGFAAHDPLEKGRLRQGMQANLGIVSAYNDMLSAHQPLERYPALIKAEVLARGAVAQFAGGVPAMCDGITQGQVGMELSLLSRDVIAMSTAIALSHDMFDAALLLGVCDKIVPGLLMGALSFGHLPVVFVPAGPMPSGLPNPEKSRIRQAHAEGKVGREELLEAEAQSYHAPGTCTFYGTANSNQLLMEIMGLHLPGASFVSPNTPLRDALTRAAARRALELTGFGLSYTPIGAVVDERAILNGVVGLLATGGSTNHTLHLVAIAAAAGIVLTWDDFEALSEVVPLLARVYPNGTADINHFQAAGGMAFLIRELLAGGFLHEDVLTVAGVGLRRYTQVPTLNTEEPHTEGLHTEGLHTEELVWGEVSASSGDEQVLRPLSRPFASEGGLRILRGNLGRAVIKVSAVKPLHRVVEAPALVFETQEALLDAYQAGRLERDFIAVLRFQGPRANGMPELHQLTPTLGMLQDRGYRVGLVTDGRMSGASGKVPAAIHVTPEALSGGLLAYVRDGDPMRLDAERGVVEVLLDESSLRQRVPGSPSEHAQGVGFGRELFGALRAAMTGAEEGARSFGASVLQAGVQAVEPSRGVHREVTAVYAV
ncbi:MAG: phosphogluconate dehydratase [Myxococcota bacterium]